MQQFNAEDEWGKQVRLKLHDRSTGFVMQLLFENVKDTSIRTQPLLSVRAPRKVEEVTIILMLSFQS